MKKKYFEPYVTIETLEPLRMICNSGVRGSGDPSDPGSDIGYGGVDEDGELDPAARRFDIWEDETEEENESTWWY